MSERSSSESERKNETKNFEDDKRVTEENYFVFYLMKNANIHRFSRSLLQPS